MEGCDAAISHAAGLPNEILPADRARAAGRKYRYVHGSRRAPRCLPCNYTDPLEASGVGERINAFNAVKACPCNLDAMCKGPPNPHVINSAWVARPRRSQTCDWPGALTGSGPQGVQLHAQQARLVAVWTRRWGPVQRLC